MNNEIAAEAAKTNKNGLQDDRRRWEWSLQADDETSAVVTKLTAKARSAGLQPEDLDETVHDLKSSTASDINNGGLDAQVRYLVKEMGPEEAERQIGKLIAEKE